jgi:hypothetical protein
MQVLPKGSVILDKSQKGGTLYIEPKPAMELNNEANRLNSLEQKEEEKVLQELCGFVAAAMDDIDAALDAVLHIDLAHARAGHARFARHMFSECRTRRPDLPSAMNCLLECAARNVPLFNVPGCQLSFKQHCGLCVQCHRMSYVAQLRTPLLSALVLRCRWIGGSAPQLITCHDAGNDTYAHLHDIMNPILLAPALEPLPAPPKDEPIFIPGADENVSEDEAAPLPTPADDASMGPNFGINNRNARRHNGSGSTSSASHQKKHDGERAAMPRPVDLRVPKGARVAAVTGPNTGGKTAALKTLGVSALMAQAGLFLRFERDKEDASRGDLDPPKVWHARVTWPLRISAMQHGM